MLSSPSRGPWVFTLLVGSLFGCAQVSRTPASVAGAPSASPSEKTQQPAARGTVEAFLDPGSATEIEPVLADSELAQPNATERLKLGQQSRAGADRPHLAASAAATADASACALSGFGTRS
jgi:hypothetical protein